MGDRHVGEDLGGDCSDAWPEDPAAADLQLVPIIWNLTEFTVFEPRLVLEKSQDRADVGRLLGLFNHQLCHCDS